MSQTIQKKTEVMGTIHQKTIDILNSVDEKNSYVNCRSKFQKDL